MELPLKRIAETQAHLVVHMATNIADQAILKIATMNDIVQDVSASVKLN
jgi:hypothetical protein